MLDTSPQHTATLEHTQSKQTIKKHPHKFDHKGALIRILQADYCLLKVAVTDQEDFSMPIVIQLLVMYLDKFTGTWSLVTPTSGYLYLQTVLG